MTIEDLNITAQEIPEDLLRCRCPDCSTSKQRACNSNRLKELMGNMFDEEPEDKFQGLYCRKAAGAPAVDDTTVGVECLCSECELAQGNGRNFCKLMSHSG